MSKDIKEIQDETLTSDVVVEEAETADETVLEDDQAPAETELKELVVFVSGSQDVNEKDFMQYYYPALAALQKLEQPVYYVMSDEPGVAELTQMYLNQTLSDKSVVSVFGMKDQPTVYVNSDFVYVTGFSTIEERDAAMTASSNKDLHVILGGKGSGNVEKNICRRLTPRYDYRKYVSPKHNLSFWALMFGMVTPEQLEQMQKKAEEEIKEEQK